MVESPKDRPRDNPRMGNCLRREDEGCVNYEQMENVVLQTHRMSNCFGIRNWCANDENDEHQLTHNEIRWRHRLRNWFGIWSCFKSDENEEHRQREYVAPAKNGMTDCFGADGHDKYQRTDDEDCDRMKIVVAKNNSHDELSNQLDENKKELTMLRSECSELRKRNNDLSRQRNESQQQVDVLVKQCIQLRTRLSETASMQLTEGNPNIADLSDQNRPDKLAEQFSELYDNEWTDCFQVLVDGLQRPEEESIQTLLHIVQTSYHICLERSQNVTTTAKEILFAFAGRSDTETDKDLDALIQEILHNLRSFRTKNVKAAPANIGKEVTAKLLSTICEPVVNACSSFIEKCIKICWLMCIKDPPVYIFCNKEAFFDQNTYVPYTKTGPEISYVVWPALYLYRNGPLMRRGVAQGQEGNNKVNASSPLLLELDHLQDYPIGIQATTKRDSEEKAKFTIPSEELPSKDSVGSTNNISHVTGFEGNRDDSGMKQATEAAMQQTTPEVVHKMIEVPTLECSVIESNSLYDYKERLENDTAMSDLG